MNRYRFEYSYVSNGTSNWGCYVDAPDAARAWALFEATHPPSRCVVHRMRLFWDGATNRPASNDINLVK